MFLSDEARGQQVGSLLEWAMIRAWQRCAAVTSMSFGPQVDELPGLTQHKRALGIPERVLPVRTRMLRPVAAYLRHFRPGTYRRSGLAGRTRTP